MALDNLRDLFNHELRDLYGAETQIVQALPRLADAAHANDLQEALRLHLEQTRAHVERLEAIAGELNLTPGGKVCAGMQGLLQEGDELIAEPAADWVKDAALIGAAQRVEHYEIAAYGTARDHAEKLGLYQIARVLQTTLDEEGDADKKLTEIAAASVNALAAL